jgi:pimeloyl-ACP methyl ester carboxylesterase
MLMILFFNTPQAKNEVKKLCQDKLDELPLPYEYLILETSFGNTNIILTGKANKPPLMLIYGLNGCLPFILESMIGLLDDFRVYAIDVMDQPDMSKEPGLSVQDNSYGQWMFEILAWLNIRDAVLVGISFGGFIGMKTLVLDERFISKVFLIVPAGIVNGCALKTLWKAGLPMKLYKWLKGHKHIPQFPEELLTKNNEFALASLSKVLLNYEMKFTPFPLIKREEAQKIKKPVHIIAAERDILFSGVKLLKRAKTIFPSLGEVLLLRDSKHISDLAGNKRIVEFIKSHVK